MEMKEEWLMPGAVVPVDAETTAALVAEIKRLIGVVGGMALNLQPAQHERVQPDSECKEDDGCPTEKAVLQRFWRKAQQQEPVAVYVGETWCGSVVRLYEDLPLETPLYTSPPASKPLTDEQIKALWHENEPSPYFFTRAIEAAHGIKE